MAVPITADEPVVLPVEDPGTVDGQLVRVDVAHRDRLAAIGRDAPDVRQVGIVDVAVSVAHDAHAGMRERGRCGKEEQQDEQDA